ncbi:hypothetical protein [Halorubrum gandharaense]
MRRTWYGYGTLTRTEKSGVGIFLHDATRISAEMTVLALPVLLFVMDSPTTGWFDAKATGLLALTVAIVAGTLVRGGWIRPLGSATPGWVTLAPVPLVVRIPYFNALFALAIFGGLVVGGVVGAPNAGDTIAVAVGLGWAVGIALVGTVAFPRVAEEAVARVG